RGVEVRRGALDRRHEVLGRVGVAGAEQDDRLADLGTLAQYVQHEVRGAVGTERPAEDVDARQALATRRGRGRSRERARGTDATNEGQRRRTGKQLALQGHGSFPSRNPQPYPAYGLCKAASVVPSRLLPRLVRLLHRTTSA